MNMGCILDDGHDGVVPVQSPETKPNQVNLTARPDCGPTAAHFRTWHKCEVPTLSGDVCCWGLDGTCRGHQETDAFDLQRTWRTRLPDRLGRGLMSTQPNSD